MANTTFTSGELVTAGKLNTVNPSIISTDSTVDENFLTRFSLRTRGQSLQYQFAGTGMMKLRGMRAELTDSSNNLTTKYE